jgi:hypothetical protein
VILGSAGVGPNYRWRKRGTAPMKPWLVATITKVRGMTAVSATSTATDELSLSADPFSIETRG